MSEEIDLDANNLSITESVFEQFQSTSAFEEDEYITLSDIVPPQPSVPDLSQELNEIPFDNEVVLGSPSSQNVEDHVNIHNDTGSQFLDISGNNVCQLDTSGEGYHLNKLSRDVEISNSRPKRQKVMDYYNERHDLSSDGLGSQNYVFEDGASIIQDSLLSTTVGQSDTSYGTPSEAVGTSSRPRRTKRGRIPNTAKYPMTSASSIDSSKTTSIGRRRPGRPKKVLPVQATFEPDSTNVDNFSLPTENGKNVTDGSGLDELTPNSAVNKGRRGKAKLSLQEDITPTPSKRGRKPKTKLASEALNNCEIRENTLVEFTKDDVNISQINPDWSAVSNDVNSAKLSPSKRKKPGPKKKFKAGTKARIPLEIVPKSDLDDDADDICLSKLKHDLNPIETEPKSSGNVQNDLAKPLTDIPCDTEGKPNDEVDIETEPKLDDSLHNEIVAMVTQNSANSEEASVGHKRNSKTPIMTDFEYNVDKVVKEATAEGQPDITNSNECLLVEDTSKRRRTAKKTFVYDEGSDEDPFANMESSDEEPKMRKKGGTKYYSDDEYVPDSGSKKRGGKIQSSSSESEDEIKDDKNKNMGYSPFKKGRKPLSNKSLVTTIKPTNEDDDIEVCLETTMIKVDESLKPPAEAWATSNEFENFIAQKTQGTSLKIKKVSSKETTDTLAPLDIPVVKQNEPKKTIEISTQTSKARTSTIGVQTSAPYDIPMKTNISLTATQSEKACEFLSSVVKTTVELGQLMSQKSDDFMNKKINTEHVTDTFKMDYCVRKSFLLFKLAKHNLLQMEEDLANQYDAFLIKHNLSSCREIPKKITPKPKKEESDSDCEIVEVLNSSASSSKKPEKSKFNPKTVFLNKELSIKIAKKPNAPEKPVPGKKKLEMKGRHAVWINKNVMVKKVTPTQSFLAQDSRNKKPPDAYITEKMVSDFFEEYNHRKALFLCAPFLNTDWTRVKREFVCQYFVNEFDATSASRNTNDLSAGSTENGIETPDENCNIHEISHSINPKSLLSLCIEAIRLSLHVKKNQAQTTQKLTCNVTDGIDTKKPVALFRLCVDAIRSDHLNHYKTQEEHDTVQINKLLDLSDQNIMERSEDVLKEINDLSDQYNMQENNINDSLSDTSDQYNIQVTGGGSIQVEVSRLTTICYKNIKKIFSPSAIYQETFPCLLAMKASLNNIELIDCNIEDELERYHMALLPCDKENSQSDNHSQKNNGVKPLVTLCVELIQSLQRFPKTPVQTRMGHPSFCELKSLKSIAFESVQQILYPTRNNPKTDILSEKSIENENIENFTINSVNTLSEEAFQSLQIPLQIRIRKQSQASSNFSDGFDTDVCGAEIDDEIDSNVNHEADDSEWGSQLQVQANDNGWASQLQVQEFRSCFTPHVDTTENMAIENNEILKEPDQSIPQIKSEPIDYFPEENIVDTSIVKTEPPQTLHALSAMTHIPDSIIAKKELTEVINEKGGSPLIESSSSFNVESFEKFVRSNKMIQSMDETNDEIFSQSGLRIRRQHEPDVDQGNDTSMSLLVPHTFEPLQLVEAKSCLMESSSGDDSSRNKKNTGKKKDKRKKKTKKDVKTTPSKETPLIKEKIGPENELAVLTRKMKEKIRQEEKKVESSDSDSDTLYLLNTKKDKSKKDAVHPEGKQIESSGSDSETLYMLSNISNKDEKTKLSKKENNKIKELKNKNSKEKDDVVQCNNVDSTEKGYDSKKTKTKELDTFSGFTAIDQNEMTNYQKLMQYVYDKIIPSGSEDIVKTPAITPEVLKDTEITPEDSNDTGPIIHPDEPVELLECEPTMPIFDMEPKERSGPKEAKNKAKKNVEVEKAKLQFTDCNGWHCYPIDSKDIKLYSDAQIVLEKLPESFVETYMEYQDVMDKDLDDQEVDRLINLQSLNRSISIKDSKPKSRLKGTSKEPNSENNSNGPPSPTYSDNFDELIPSDDEAPLVEDVIPPPMPVQSSENIMAKDLLMDDPDSDSDGAGGKKIKQELAELDNKQETTKPGPKSKTKNSKIDSESLMLTADKMMNKELALLHAPIVLQDDIKGTIARKETSPKDEAKTSKKISKKHSRDRVKNDDDSSSEEEKQWVSTKEKLLKRLGRKEDAIADDAKRAKLVNEFIERRSETDRKNKRESGQGRKGRARRKRLERQKQLRFLSNELYNDGDGITTGKRQAAAGLFKGRRNIRKVIDKKSLARSTVVANMEEFERKRRLNMRQNKLREVLGCEEGVNVLVINDEVCLEYDFEEQRPVVTVHPFFTKVMKAHQYEGVKFMWDACFESLGTIERGHGGGGCILAHCMGLGKTLQVLALLHTVLTHPRASMHRVLVCCPLSTVLNWVDEIHKWIGPVTHEIKVFELSKLRKTYERAYQLEDWYSGGGIFIIGYELFRSLTTLDPEIDEIRPTIINKIRTALLDPGPDIIVCDEGHLLKNDCSVLAVAMSRVVTKRRIVLTGTPMQNNLREYFCMVNFIKPNLLGTYSEYSNRFENPIMNGQHRDSVDEDIKLMKARTHILHKVLEGCLQRQEASVLYPYLPKKHEYTVFIPLTQCQWDLYNHYMDNYAKTTKQSVLRDFHILQKIWSHPQVLHSFQLKARDKKDKIKAEKLEDDLAIADQEPDIKPPETEVWWLQYLGEGAMLDCLDSSNKFVAVFRILHECVALGDKVLIFSTSLFCLDALEFFLKKIKNWSLGQEYYRLDGSVPAEVRQKWCREFNADNNIKTKLFLISTRAGCLGLNMTAANRVIILDTSWNPAHDIQSIFRVYRFGQKKDCYIYRLVALGTMEQKIYERSVTKQAVACRVVDEQQIDRHYNLAELTELYSVDEMGLSVAGGVAIGVGDVALLRVARDAAIHAVHEHDSLLRGSGEQGLPEHERAAAWNQFQQEHEHKQMQNDLSANRAVVALKRLEMEHLRQQALYAAAPVITPDVAVKSEPPASDYPFLVPLEEQPGKSRGRKHKRAKIVQCRIPIASGPQPGPSTASDLEIQQDMVQKITNLLIKHNFMQNQSGPKQISELVTKVKKMVATGQPMTLGPGYDELSSSIANVLLNREVPMPEVPMPPLTNVETPIIPEPEPTKRGKKIMISQEQIPLPTMPPVEDIQQTDGRLRRKAALAAEMQFQNERDVIDLDTIDCDWQNDDDDDFVVDEPVVEPEPVVAPAPAPVVLVKKESNKKNVQEVESSILLSDDDEAVPEVIAPAAPVPNKAIDNEVVPLHPSLLTNSNFIKIVAHTYLAGNPMMDEDAATLAAQYSTLKTLKEAESEGKPIESGAVYDIAIKVLGKDVLRKLQAANPKTSDSSCAASNKLQTLLGEAKPSAPSVKKPKIGPKSKVTKEIKEEPTDARRMESNKNTSDTARSNTGPLRVSKSVFASSAAFGAVRTDAESSAPREESILPDEEASPIHDMQLDRKPIILRKVNIERKSQLKQIAATAMPVALVRAPAPLAAPPSDATICLDSDEEDAAPAPPSRLPQIVQMPAMFPASQSSAPVPVALTGPRNVPSAPRPHFYTLSPCGTRAIPMAIPGGGASQPVPISVIGHGPAPRFPGAASPTPSAMYAVPGRHPVPISLMGPDSRPIPMALGAASRQPAAVSSSAPAMQPVPMSLVDSSGRSVTLSAAKLRSQKGPLTLRFEQQQNQYSVSSVMPSSSPPAPVVSAPPPQESATPAAAGPSKIRKAGDRATTPINKLVDILNRKKAKVTSKNENTRARTIADSPPPLTPKPTTMAPSPPPPMARPEGRRARRRRQSSSSSSNSSRSRSSSPDPLARILKDVVHIQAPQPKENAPSKPAPPKPAPQKPAPSQKHVTNTFTNKGSNPPPAKPTQKPTVGGRAKFDRKSKESPVSASVDLTKGYLGPSKSNSGAKKPISASFDLTSTPGGSRSSSSKDSGAKHTEPSNRSYITMDSSNSSAKGNKPTAKPNGPTKLVGTSKSIILDGKSKTLKMENKNAGKAIQVTSSKVIQGASTSKPKLGDKRSGPSTPAPDPKKKKTEPMTLKDFDIDDIDDIIELD